MFQSLSRQHAFSRTLTISMAMACTRDVLYVVGEFDPRPPAFDIPSSPDAAGTTRKEVFVMVAIASRPPRPSVLEVPFPAVLSDVRARAALAYPDAVLPLGRLRATETGLVEVPQVGQLALTDWSRGQLSRLLGLRWQRWFDPTLCSPAEQAEEINRRLSRHSGELKIRASRYPAGTPAVGDGILRAFVGEKYTPIDDVRVFERLERVLGPRAESFRFVRETLTDRTSQYVAVTPDDVDLSNNGKPDLHRHGFLIVNSEVGARALAIAEYLFRIVCTNGLIIMSASRRLFYRVHRKTEDESIDRDLAYALALLPERWSASASALRAVRRHLVEEPEQMLRQVLAESPDTKPYTEAVLVAFRKEPEATRFGLVQAITRAAQSVGAEDRLALEMLAGRLVGDNAAQEMAA